MQASKASQHVKHAKHASTQAHHLADSILDKDFDYERFIAEKSTLRRKKTI